MPDDTAKLYKQLQALGRNAQGRALRAAVRAGITPAIERARQLIPVGIDKHITEAGREVRPGFARKSIRGIIKVSRDKSVAIGVIGVRKTARYAVQFVELGTSRMAAQPWLRPAFRETRRQQEQAL